MDAAPGRATLAPAQRPFLGTISMGIHARTTRGSLDERNACRDLVPVLQWPSTMSYLLDLQCPECGEHYSAEVVQTYCHNWPGPLLARYDLARAAAELARDALSRRPRGMWRWRELLPVRDPANEVSLGEGDAPLLPAPRLAAKLGLARVWIKDESFNPTGTFKARGMAAAVSRAKELGLRELVTPTAGNAGGALAAYAARAGLPAHGFIPQDAPRANAAEARVDGAEVTLV